MRNPFNVGQWIAWLGATIAAATGMVSMAYTTFETKNESIERKEMIEKRLDRIENKIDKIIDRSLINTD